MPPPLAAMLEKKHGMFGREPHDLHLVSGERTTEEACAALLVLAGSRRGEC